MNLYSKRWTEKMMCGETMTLRDLYPFATIKLKKARMRKKFEAHPERYVRPHIWTCYQFGGLAFNLVRSSMPTFPSLEPVRGEDLPTGELIYLDYRYTP